MRKVLLITLIISSMLVLLLPSKSILKSASFSVQLCPRFLPVDCNTGTTTPGDGTPFAAFVVIEGFSPDKSYSIKSRIGPYSQDMTYAISWKNTTLNKWAVDNTSSSDLIKINTDSSGNWKGWVIAKVKKTAPQGTILYRVRLDVEPYGGNYTDSFSIGTGSLNMQTQGGWIEGIAYDTYGNPVSGYPVVVKDSTGTIVGIYLTEDNGVIEGYPSNQGYFKVSAPAGGPYSVEICDPVTLGTIGKIISGVFVTAGQITAGVNINEPVYYKLSVNIIGEGLVEVNPNSIGGTYLEGTEVTLTAIPSMGYHFVSWAGDIPIECETDNPVKIAINSHKVIAATFEINMYTITASAGPGGHIAPLGLITMPYNSEQRFDMIPNVGYHIKEVLTDGKSIGVVSSYTFTNITENHLIEATFEINKYTMIASSDNGGYIFPNGEISVEFGSSQVFTFNPNTGYHIKNVLVDNQSVGVVSSYTFTNITANHTIEAQFEINTYTVAFDSQGGSAVPSYTSVTHGSIIPAPIPPIRTGYNFAGWYKEANCENAWDFTTDRVTYDISLYAKWTINTYTLNVNVLGSGSVIPAGGTYEYGTFITFTAIPDIGWHFAGWSGDVSSLTNPITVIIDSEKTITATFEINVYTITSFSGPGGSINPSGEISVNYGGSAAFEIKADPGFIIYRVLIDGKPFFIENNFRMIYPFRNIESNHTIIIEFAKIPDITPPVLTLPTLDGINLNVPGNKILVSSAVFNFPIYATDESGIERIVVKVNGVVQIDKNNLHPTIYLSEGDNLVEVVVYDTYGNFVAKSFNIICDTKSPMIFLEDIPEVVSALNLILKGTVLDATTGIQSLTINGKNVIVTNHGNFEANLTLSYGTNTIIIEAIDQVNNKTTKIFTSLSIYLF